MSTPTILCVDDERNILLTLRTQLSRYFPDYRIEIAETAAEALELVDERQAEGSEVHLVIADQIMPGMNGDELLVELHARYPQILTVMLTGQASAADVGNAVNRGNLYRFLAKPWSEADLSLTVSEALRQYQQRQQLAQQQRGLEQSNQELKSFNADLEQQVQERTQQLRLFVEHTPAALAILDRDMHYILTSHRWKEDYSLGDQEIIGRSHYEVIPDIPERWREINQRCLAGAVERAEEDCFVREDGSVVWNQWEICPWYNADSEIGGIIIVAQVITERKQTELALQESEEQNRAILSAIPDIMTVVSADGKYLSCSPNQFSGELLPLGDVALGGMHVSELLPQEAASQCLAAVQAALQTGEPQRYEQQIQFGDRIQYEEARIVPYQSDRVLCMVRNITEAKQDEIRRRQVEADLATVEAAQRSVLENIPSFIAKVDRTGTMLFLNRVAVGFTMNDVIGRSLEEFTAPESQEIQQTALARVFETGESTTIEILGTGANGAPAYYELRIAPITETGRIEAAILVATDITERKQAELSLKQLNEELELRVQQRTQELQTQTFRLQLAIESAQMGIWESNLETGIWSERTEAIFGYAPGTFPGDRDAFLRLVHPEDQERVFAALAASFATRVPYNVEYRIHHLEGELRWVAVNGKVMEADDAGLRMVGVALDITERKQAEERLQQFNQELEQHVAHRTIELQQAMEAAEAANLSKSMFLANMSHELRTPLNAILGFSQLLGRYRTLQPEQQQQVDIINRSGAHLLSLINDILEMSKIEAGRAILTVERFDLQELIQNLQDLFWPKAESKGLELIIERVARVPRYIQTDGGKLRQVLTNLLSNAIKFTQAGHVRLRVEVRSGERRSETVAEPRVAESLQSQITLYFEVADSGPGIDPTEQAALFEPFVQTKTGQASHEGTGLGLPISRRFVQLMGGDLTCQTVYGQGATFWFQIPVIPVSAADLPTPTPIRKVIGLAPDQPRYRILVVEDQPENRLFLVQLLQSVGFEVQQAVNGKEAIAQFQQWHPDLIWMDMRMPILDGYEATRQIRNSSTSAISAKIIALTASAFEDERADILAAGCDDLVCKPVTEAVLFEVMAQQIGVRYLYEELTDGSESGTNTEQLGELLSAAVQGMPPDWIKQLQWAARTLDEDLILQLLEQLPANQAALAQALRALVNDFRLDRLIELTGCD